MSECLACRLEQATTGRAKCYVCAMPAISTIGASEEGTR